MAWNERRNQALQNTLEGTGKGFVGRPTGVTGVLARLVRTTIHDLGINGGKWDSLMETYLRTELKLIEKKRRNKLSDKMSDQLLLEGSVIDETEINRRDRTSIRGNLNKEFKRKIMTWKVFCKGMRFLQVRRFKIVILAEQYNGRVTEHSTIVSFEDVQHELMAEDDPSQGEEGDVQSNTGEVLTDTPAQFDRLASQNFEKV